MKSYRCRDKDLTISILNKTYLESTYKQNTGDELHFGKTVLESIMGMKNGKMTKSSENISFYIINQKMGNGIDTDVAGLYNDDKHFIIVEGGDVDFIKNITNSIKIKNP